MATQKKISLRQLKQNHKELDEATQRRIKGGFRIVPNIQTSYGSFPWLEIDIRTPTGTPPGNDNNVKIIDVFNP